MGRENGTYLRTIHSESFPDVELPFMLTAAKRLRTVESVKVRTAGKERLRLVITHRTEAWRDV